MKKFITALLVNVISLWVIDYLMSSIYIATPNALFAIAFVLMILNVTLKPLMKLIFLPVTFLSFGLFSLIINAVVLATAFSFAPGSYIRGFPSAFIASVLLSIANSAINSYIE